MHRDRFGVRYSLLGALCWHVCALYWCVRHDGVPCQPGHSIQLCSYAGVFRFGHASPFPVMRNICLCRADQSVWLGCSHFSDKKNRISQDLRAERQLCSWWTRTGARSTVRSPLPEGRFGQPRMSSRRPVASHGRLQHPHHPAAPPNLPPPSRPKARC